MGPRVFRLLLASLLAGLVLTAVTVWRHCVFVQRTEIRAKADLQQLTRLAAGRLDTILRRSRAAADTVAAELDSGRLPHEDGALAWRLTALLHADPNLDVVALAYEPYAFDPQRRLFSVVLKAHPGAEPELRRVLAGRPEPAPTPRERQG